MIYQNQNERTWSWIFWCLIWAVFEQLQPNLAATDDAGNTALHLAVKADKADIVDTLIKVSQQTLSTLSSRWASRHCRHAHQGDPADIVDTLI